MRTPTRYARGLFSLFLAGIGASFAAVHAGDSGAQIVVNAVPLTADSVQALQRIYPVPIQPGRYWYDAFSGALGREGGPPSFNLALCAGAGGQSRGGGSSTRTFCDPDGSCRSSGLWGSILTVPR